MERIFLTEDQKATALDALHKELCSMGYKVHRATAWRAKSRGWFYYKFNSARVGERVWLMPEHKKLSASVLAKMFGLGERTARMAKQRGWFQITTNNRGKARKVPVEVVAPPVVKKPQSIKRIKVNLTSQEKLMTAAKLAERFKVSRITAWRALKSGWLLSTKNPEDRTVGDKHTKLKVRFTTPKATDWGKK